MEALGEKEQYLQSVKRQGRVSFEEVYTRIMFIQVLRPLALFFLVGKGHLTLAQVSVLLGEERRDFD